MKKNYVFICFYCILNISILLGQATFRVSYDVANFDIAGGMVETPLGDFVIAGTNASFLPYFGNVIKLDNQGNVVWAKSYTGGIATTFTDIKNVSGGGFIVCGQSSSGGAILVRLDNLGNVTWAKRYLLPDINSNKISNEFFNAVIPTSDGGFLAVGGVDYFWDGVSPSTVDTTSLFAVKVNSSGTTQWSRVWTVNVPNPDEHYLNDCAEVSDGYILVGTSSEGSGTLNSDGDYPRNGIILKVNKSNGSNIYIHRFGAGNSTSQEFNSIITLSNGNVLTGGYDDIHAFIARFQGTGNTASFQWGRRINGSSFPPITHVIQDIMENSDGNYSIIGWRIEALSFSFYSMILKINSSTGALIFGKGYTPIGLSSILPEGGLAADQGYYMAMTDQQMSGFNYNVIRTDPSGQINTSATGCNHTNLNPGTANYTITLQTVNQNSYTIGSESTFSPIVNNLNPTKNVHCLVTPCVPPAAPNVNATPNPICAGQSTTITVTNPTTGVVYNVYTSSTGGTNLGSTPLTVSPSSTTTYYVEAALQSNPSCVSTTRTPITITVNPLPNVTPSSNSPVCQGQTLNLTVNSIAGATYNWTGPNGFSSTQQNPSISNVTTANSGTYTVTITDANGCSNSANVNVTINSLPAVTASSNSPVCTGSTLQLNGGPSGMSNYTWTGPNGFSSNQQNPSINNVTASNAGNYTLTVTDANGCSNSATVNVTITNPPVASIFSSKTTICSGDTLHLIAGGTGSYSWLENGSPAGSSSTLIINPSTNSTYILTVTAGSCSDSDTLNISVNPLPSVNASASPANVCEGDSLLLNASGNGTAYIWSGPNNFSANQQNTQIYNITSQGSGYYTVTITDANGCKNKDSVMVTVNAKPNIQLTPDTNICQGDSITLIASGGASYQWNNGSNTSSITVNPSQTTQYSVTVTGSNGCKTTGIVTVTVNTKPNAQINGNTFICQGTSTTLTASGGNTYLWNTGQTGNSITVSPSQTTSYSVVVSNGNCKDTAVISVTVNSNPTAVAWGDTVINQTGEATIGAGGGVQYSWSPTDGLSCHTCISTTAKPDKTTDYCVTVTDANGCKDTACVRVVIEIECGEVFVPNIFSPNGDGLNDVVKVHGYCIKELEWAIYDRWGEQVFYTSDPQQAWDGTYKGKLMNGAVFHYRLKAVLINGKIEEQKGTITLIR